MEEVKRPLKEERKTQKEEIDKEAETKQVKATQPQESGNGGGWGFSPFSILSDLQKAAQELSRNAETAAKSLADMSVAEDSESSKEEEEAEESATDMGSEDEIDKLRKSALDKLEKASEDSIFGQTRKAFTSKGMHVLELVGKETMDLGIEVDRSSEDGGEKADENQLYEEVTFDRCFHINGYPEQLEELEAARQEKDTGVDGSGDEIKDLHNSSVSKAADMAASFTTALSGQAVNDNQKTTGRL